MKELYELMLQFRAQLEALMDVLTDGQAAVAPLLSKPWKVGAGYTTGERVQNGGKLYKCLQPHTSQESWNPADALSLWAEVLPGQDGTEIGEWVQPDSTNAYMQGDKVSHNGKTWKSYVDNNVWEPGVYGWNEITE